MLNPKIQVGTKVRYNSEVTCILSATKDKPHVGQVGTVIEVDDGDMAQEGYTQPYNVQFDDGCTWWLTAREADVV